MKYGMPTLIENDNIEDTAALCKKLNLDFIEINMNLPQYQVSNVDTKELNRVANQYGISYTIHVDENMNPFDYNFRVATAYLDTMLDTVILAKELSVPIINMHMPSGVYFTMPDAKIYLFDRYNDTFMTKMKEFLTIMEQAISKDNIKICIENGGIFEKFQLDTLNILLDSHIFSLTYDIGHAACNETMMRELYSLHIEKLAHMHVHDARVDNIGKWMDHLALGKGNLDLEYYFELAKITNSSIVLETKTIEGLTQSVNWLKSHDFCTY